MNALSVVVEPPLQTTEYTKCSNQGISCISWLLLSLSPAVLFPQTKAQPFNLRLSLLTRLSSRSRRDSSVLFCCSAFRNN
jgi:hypothetical protein